MECNHFDSGLNELCFLFSCRALGSKLFQLLSPANCSADGRLEGIAKIKH